MEAALVVLTVLALAGIAFWAGMRLGARTQGRKAKEDSLSREDVRKNADLISNCCLLEELRKGQSPELLDCLEFAVDCGVSSLAARLDKMHPSHREFVLATLNRVKEYRKQYPRQICPAPALSEEIVRSVKEAADEAYAVLAELAPPANSSLQATAAPPAS